MIYSPDGDQVVTDRPAARVELGPGQHAYVVVNQYRCDLGDRVSATALSLVPPGNTAAVSVSLVRATRTLAYCGPGDPGSILHVSSIVESDTGAFAH